MKVFIINFNRLTLPSKMADWLSVRGCEPIFIDNHSDYPPLLEYYYNCPYIVFRMKENYGHKVIWEQPQFNKFITGGRYIVTDPDLNLSGIPPDFLQVLNEGLDKYPEYDKCGFSLEINDLPDTEEGSLVRNKFEFKYWTSPLDSKYYKADVDTTFALCKQPFYSHSGIRTNRPYTARHVPWYYKDFESLSEEDKYYFRTANESSSGKKRLMK